MTGQRKPPAGAAAGAGRQRPRILYLVTEDWYFCLHRLPVARAARDAGFEVVVATRVTNHGERITGEGFRLIPLQWRRRSLHPWRELRALFAVAGIYRSEKPELAHHIALKPAVYGSVAARLARVPASVSTVAGLGYVFTSREWKARVLKQLLKATFRSVLRKSNVRMIFENPDDRDVLTAACRPRPEQMVLIRGTGVDVRLFKPSPQPADVVVTLVSRMLWNKGIGELVEAAKRLHDEGENIRFLLVGSPDPENPASIAESRLRSWQQAGHVEWLGQRDDVPEIWGRSAVAVLPTTYGEGVPRCLLEAAACGLPIIATDTAGCREIVRDGENGFLVPPGDAAALAEKIRKLAGDPELRAAMGANGRELVTEHFSEELVVRQTLDVYRSLAGTES
ncbi:MAG: glycosyltransferase family 4 protein [Candidatus Krumholzibacteriia bacterium]